MATATKESGKRTKNKVSYSLVKMAESLKWIFNNKTIQNANGLIKWGEKDDLPELLFASYLNNVYHNTIVNTLVDMVVGDGIILSTEMEQYIRTYMAYSYDPDGLAVNADGEDLQDIVKQAAYDLINLGTYSYDLYYSPTRDIAELHYMDVVRCRLYEDRKNVNYRNDIRSYYTSQNGIKIPLFNTDISSNREVFMHLDKNCRTIYPMPYYFAALNNLDISTKITQYLSNSIDNGFSAFRIVVYPGMPSDDEKHQIVRDFSSTYTGPDGASTMFMFKEGGESPEIITVPDDKAAEKYINTEESNSQQIFAGFRIMPVLLGILTKTTGFSEQEFFEAYKLTLNTLVKSFRNELIRDISYIFGIKEPFRFKPTTLEMSIDQNMSNDVSQ